MKKKKPYGHTLREQLVASAKDRLYSFLLDFGGIRGALVHATRMVNEMRANHELGTLETLLLGHAYIATGLMTVNLKGSDRVSIRVPLPSAYTSTQAGRSQAPAACSSR